MTEALAPARRVRFAVRMELGRAPLLHHVVAAWNWARVCDGHALVRHDTALVIDGFPSSGNSFAIAALRTAAAQTGVELPRLAHHLHCAGQVRAAVGRSLPVLLLVRDPAANAASALTRWPHLRAAGVLRAYERYHLALEPHLAAVEVATFDQVTCDFGLVVRSLNERYGLELPVFDHTGVNERLVYDPEDPGRASRRRALVERRREVDSAPLAEALGRARRVYARFEACARRSAAGG